MEIEDYVERIVENNNIEDMHALSEILDDVMEELCKYDEEKYNKYKMELYKMAFGNVLNKEMAEEIVLKMRPYGKRWSIEESIKMQEQYGLENIRAVDFFIVINSAYNDYRNLFEDNLEDYINFTVDFIMDEDAKSDKIFLYYTTIPQE